MHRSATKKKQTSEQTDLLMKWLKVDLRSRLFVLCYVKSAFWYPASRGYIFAVWAGVRKVASADNRSVFYRACAKFVTRFASNWFVKSAWVSRESNLRKLPANYSPRASVWFFCFAPSGFKYFSRKISTDRLCKESIFKLSTVVSPVCFAGSAFNFKRQFFRLITNNDTLKRFLSQSKRSLVQISFPKFSYF